MEKESLFTAAKAREMTAITRGVMTIEEVFLVIRENAEKGSTILRLINGPVIPDNVLLELKRRNYKVHVEESEYTIDWTYGR